ncbi:hypothetical protein ACR6C2_03985 [Streptomyces sp. INA 01156]
MSGRHLKGLLGRSERRLPAGHTALHPGSPQWCTRRVRTASARLAQSRAEAEQAAMI